MVAVVAMDADTAEASALPVDVVAKDADQAREASAPAVDVAATDAGTARETFPLPVD